MNLDDFPKLEYNNNTKMSRIENILLYLGYCTDTGKDVVDAIEQNNLDLSQFEFPYGSFEAFKEHALAGEFDMDVYACAALHEEIAELHRLVKDKKLHVLY